MLQMAHAFRSILLHNRLARQIMNTGQLLFSKHLFITNCMFSTVLGITGDAIQQHYDILMGEKEKYELRRASHMAAAGFTTGIATHHTYRLLEKWMPGRALRVVIKKILVDQLFFSPATICVYFTTVGLLEGSTKTILKEELLQKGSKIYYTEWIVWPPAQLFNFYVLPLRFRVIFDNLISLGFDVYCPYVKYKTQLRLPDSNQDKETIPSSSSSLALPS
ncbi:hypothetical protein LAZ67_17001170 [Cordylochernes scorpioides]|uniref:Mpv17-like protein 2 n=1 Tax=Cordylochernes scorpioides TaxID=51811 RepID=A0ABY6LD60_9ARAC|nr:hypothetical protein LAZ67_17001170 [Cordylochernes scorpioides]